MYGKILFLASFVALASAAALPDTLETRSPCTVEFWRNDGYGGEVSNCGCSFFGDTECRQFRFEAWERGDGEMWKNGPDNNKTAPYPAIPVVEHRQGGDLCGNGQFPFRPRRGIETTAEEYSDPSFDGSDDTGSKSRPFTTRTFPRSGGPPARRRPYDLRLAILDAFTEEELVNLSEIVLDTRREPSGVTSDNIRKRFGGSPLGIGQVVQAASGITMHSSLGRGTFHNELHRTSEKRQFDPDHEEIDRMLVGLTIRVEREIYGIAERFLDVLNGTDSVLFLLATDELTNPAEIKAVKKMRDNGVRIVATTHGSFIDILLHRDKNVLLGGTNTVTITDEVASQKEVFNKISIHPKEWECPMFETVVEVRSKTEYRIFPSVRSAAKWIATASSGPSSRS
ncbi:hypothetical protein HDU88_007950 [Geranomyces variabilis]|nr:hypothetical protein HDU88_007950 [Geranomyces variabilis]